MDCTPETFYVKQHNSGKECRVQDYFDKRKGTISADKLKGGVIAHNSTNPTHWHPGEKAHEEAADRIINSNIIGEMLK